MFYNETSFNQNINKWNVIVIDSCNMFDVPRYSINMINILNNNIKKI